MHNKFTLALGAFLLATPALAGGKIGDNTDKVVWEEGDADVKTTKTSL